MKKINKKIICFDLDGTLCSFTKGKYSKAKPNIKAISKVNKLYAEGHRIIIFTSRFMGRNNENISKAKKQGFKLTLNQLRKWDIKFHKLIMGKPSYDILIDDKAFRYKKFWIKKIF